MGRCVRKGDDGNDERVDEKFAQTFEGKKDDNSLSSRELLNCEKRYIFGGPLRVEMR